MENKPIRVLEMISSLYMGGSQAMIMNLYQNIDRTKVQFDFIVDHPEFDEYKSLIEELGGKIYTMPLFKGNNLNEVKKAWNDFFEQHKEYKILHSHSRSYASIYLPIARKHGLKTIIHSHSTSNGKGMKSIAKQLLQYPLRYQADYYFACTIDSGRWLFGNKVIKSDKFYILNNAIDALKYRYNLEIREQYRKKFNINNETIYIQVGSLINLKNHLFSIDVIEQLAKLEPNIKYFIIGVGENKNLIENKIKEKHLESIVTLLGRRKDVFNLLQMADCYIMPSIYEGLSVAAIEAQASGNQCFLSDTVSKDVKVTDVVEFLPLEVSKWVKALNNTFEKKDTYNQIVKAGYDIKTTSQWLQEFYLKVWDE